MIEENERLELNFNCLLFNINYYKDMGRRYYLKWFFRNILSNIFYKTDFFSKSCNMNKNTSFSVHIINCTLFKVEMSICNFYVIKKENNR